MKQPKERECSNCGAPATVARGEYPFAQSGLDVRLVGIQLIKCKKCGQTDPIIPNLADLMRVIALAVVEKPWKLCGKEIKYLRKYMQMTAHQFAGHMGVDHTTVSKWENDKIDLGDTSDRLIRALAVTLGEGLVESREDIMKKFPDIDKTIAICAYRYDADTHHVEYAHA